MTFLIAGRNIDGRIATDVLGWTRESRGGRLLYWPQPPRGYGGMKVFVPAEELPAYSTDMGAAGTVLAWMAEHGTSVDLNWGEDTDCWECSWVTSGNRHTGFSPKEEPALAVCLAALRGVGQDV